MVRKIGRHHPKQPIYMSKDKKSKKEKKVQKQLEKIQANEIEFDVIQLLKDNIIDTKPNMAKFL